MLLTRNGIKCQIRSQLKWRNQQYPSRISHLSATTANTNSDASSPDSSSNNTDYDTRKEILVHQFVAHVQESIQDQTFSSLVLRGVPKPKRKAKTKAMESSSTLGATANSLRGVIRQVQGRLISKSKNIDNDIIMLQLTWKYHGATDICKNLNLDEIPEALPELILEAPLASEWGAEAIATNPIQGAELKTSTQVIDLQIATAGGGKKKKPKLSTRVSKQTKDQQRQQQQQSQVVTAHDREKQTPLNKSADFLQALGVTHANGKPKQGMKSKLRQCQKFVEIVGQLIDKLTTAEDEDDDIERRRRRRKRRPISVVDMGCGRGYLTFSLHSYLVGRQYAIKSRGIDVRPKLVEEISSIARSLGKDFDGLQFEEGTIEKFVAEAETTASSKNQDDELGVLIALHACDTATDDAIWSGICSGASLLIVAPCCHKQVRPQLNSHYAAESQSHPLADVLKHGVYRERMSETITDSIRALLLEAAGYKVQVFEFIGGEHTSKNVMITAVKTGDPNGNDWRDPEEAKMEPIIQRIQSLAELGGIKQHKLAEWMDISLGDDLAPKAKGQRMPHQMPPMQRR
ncbi:MAG: hypothetical protein SGBAC_008494 [Bacillariaceae sp.]